MKTTFSFIVLSCLVIASCNKDGEIIADAPEGGNAGVTFTVMEYMPAPGQFIGDKASGFESFSTMEEACGYASRRMSEGNFVSLGAYGGYMVVKSSQSIRNGGGYDFAVAGNSFDTSNEPGIVWVMQDADGNGLADDEWYEIAGSDYGLEDYERGYSVTYFRPGGDNEDVRWLDSHGNEGVVSWLGAFHSQPSYYPSWVEEDSYTLSGSRLKSKALQDPATGLWSNPPFGWGYADNAGADCITASMGGRQFRLNRFRISDAVDADGNAVKLDSIDFIKVQTAVNGSSGNIGENSTEVCGFFVE